MQFSRVTKQEVGRKGQHMESHRTWQDGPSRNPQAARCEWSRVSGRVTRSPEDLEGIEVLSRAPGEIEEGHYPWGPSWMGTIRFSFPQRNLKTGAQIREIRIWTQGNHLEGGQSTQGERWRQPRSKGHFRGSRHKITTVTLLQAWGPKWDQISFQFCRAGRQLVLPFCPFQWLCCGNPRLPLGMGSVSSPPRLPLL